MNDETNLFENQLRALKVRHSDDSLAETMYQCGYAAAVATESQRKSSTRPFLGGALTGIAASLLFLAAWQVQVGENDVRPPLASPNDVEARSATVAAAANNLNTRSNTTNSDGQTEMAVPVSQSDENLFPLLYSLAAPWVGRTSERWSPVLYPLQQPLSPAAKQQWQESISERTWTTSVSFSTSESVQGESSSPIRARPFNQELLDELL